MFGKKKKPRHSWENSVLAGVDVATEWVAPKLGTAADVAEKTYRKAAPKVQDAASSAWSAASDGASAAGSKVKEYAGLAGDSLAAQYDKLPKEAKKDVEKVLAKYGDAKSDFKKKVVPAAAGTLGGYADKTAKLIHKAEVNPHVETALVRATGDKKIVKKLRKNSEQYAKKAAKELKKQQRSGRKKGLLVFGVVAAGVAAGVAVWRASRPVEDPWKKPAPVTPSATAPASKPAAQAAPKPAAPAETNTSAEPSSEVPQPKPATS